MASKLQDLINRLCPNGVEYRKLGEVCSYATAISLIRGTFLLEVQFLGCTTTTF